MSLVMLIRADKQYATLMNPIVLYAVSTLNLCLQYRECTPLSTPNRGKLGQGPLEENKSRVPEK